MDYPIYESDGSAERLGLVVSLLLRAPARRSVPLVYLRQWIEPAIAHGHIHFAFEDRGRPLAYWTWALLTPDVEERILAERNTSLHESEWNEGGNLWILDFVAPHGFVRDIVEYMRSTFFHGYSKAYALNRRSRSRYLAMRLRREISKNTITLGDSPRYRLPISAYASSQGAWLSSRNIASAELVMQEKK